MRLEGLGSKLGTNGTSSRDTITKKKKLHNVTSDNARSQWIWFNTIDEVLSGTAKTDGLLGGMDNGEYVDVKE